MKNMTDAELIAASAIIIARTAEDLVKSPIAQSNLLGDIEEEVKLRESIRKKGKIYYHKITHVHYLVVAVATNVKNETCYIYKALGGESTELYVRTIDDFEHTFEKGVYIEKSAEHQGKEF